MNKDNNVPPVAAPADTWSLDAAFAMAKRWPTAKAFLADHPESYFESNEPVERTRLAIAVDFLAAAIEAAPADQVRDQALAEAEQACEDVQSECAERDSGKWPELCADAAEGAGDCLTAIRALRTSAATGEKEGA